MFAENGIIVISGQKDLQDNQGIHDNIVLSILCYVLLLGCNDSDVANNETFTTEIESEAVSEVVEEISEEENGTETSEEFTLYITVE